MEYALPAREGSFLKAGLNRNGYHPKPTLTSIILGKEKALEKEG